MANILSEDKQIAVIGALAEGSSYIQDLQAVIRKLHGLSRSMLKVFE